MHFIFSTSEGMGREGLNFYYRSAELLSKSDSITYSCICDRILENHPYGRA